jgi:hypothetical protein
VRTIRIARSRSSSGYFLGATMITVSPWFHALHQTRDGSAGGVAVRVHTTQFAIHESTSGNMQDRAAAASSAAPRSPRGSGTELAATSARPRIREIVTADAPIPQGLLAVAADLTDAHAAIFVATHGFRGCIPGIHEVLVRDGVLAGRWCLDPAEDLSPGQAAEIDRVWGGTRTCGADALADLLSSP